MVAETGTLWTCWRATFKLSQEEVLSSLKEYVLPGLNKRLGTTYADGSDLVIVALPQLPMQAVSGDVFVAPSPDLQGEELGPQAPTIHIAMERASCGKVS